MSNQRDDSNSAGLAQSLRTLRLAAGLNQTELAKRTGLSQSQISRAEQDRRLLSPTDVAKVADACGADKQERTRLVAIAESSARQYIDSRAILQRGAYHFQERVRRFEEDSALIRAYQPGMVLGQLQSASYARAVFRIRGDRSASEIEQLVDQRLRRSEAVGDPVRRWELIQTEGALTWCLGGPAVMLEQIEHLLAVSELSNVDLGIVPAFRPVDFLAAHGFHIYDADAVVIGTATATAVLSERQDIVDYARLFARLSGAAVHGDECRKILARLADTYRTSA